MNLPKISIITPSFNQGCFIEQTIKSVIEQDYPNIELIIIDGGSTDNTLDILNKYEKFIKYWVSEPDNGQAHAINKGLSHATGDIVNWINSDDYLEPGALHIIGKYFKEHPESLALCGFTHCFYDEDGTTSHTYRMGLENTVTDTILKFAMNQPGTFYVTKVLKDLGGVNESLRYVFDNELWFKFLCKYGIKGIGTTEKLLANFRLHKSSKSVAEGFELFWYEQNDVWLHMAKQLNFSAALIECMCQLPHQNHYISDNWDVSMLCQHKFEAYWYSKYINTLYLKGDKMEARTGLLKMWQNNFAVLSRLHISLFIKLFLNPR